MENNSTVQRQQSEDGGELTFWHYQQLCSILLYANCSLVMCSRCAILAHCWPNRVDKKWLALADCVLLILPILMALTLLGASPLANAAIHLGIVACIVAFKQIRKKGLFLQLVPLQSNNNWPSNNGRQLFLDSTVLFRSLFFHTVGIAILAVDFTAFPSLFKKTIALGHGLSVMDTGAAGYLFVNVLSDYAVEQRSNLPAWKRAGCYQMNFGCFRVPMLLLIFIVGMTRTLYLMVSNYGYMKDEYGVHWNFLYTLFVLRVAVCLLPPKLLLPLGFLLGTLYQIALSLFELEQRLLVDHTVPLFHVAILDQNREGLFSLLGYFCFQSLTMLYTSCMHSATNIANWSKPRGIAANVAFGFVCLDAQWALEIFAGIVPSRRLANFAFVLGAMSIFTASMFVLQMLLLLAPMLSSLGGGLVEATCRNGLIHLIVSNLLTGLVNVGLPVRKIRGNMLLETGILLVHGVVTGLLVLLVHVIRSQVCLRRQSPTTVALHSQENETTEAQDNAGVQKFSIEMEQIPVRANVV